MTEFNFEKWKADTPVLIWKFDPDEFTTEDDYERAIRGYYKYDWADLSWVIRKDQWYLEPGESGCWSDPKCMDCGTTDSPKFFWHNYSPEWPDTKHARHLYVEKYDSGYECIDCLKRRIVSPSKL